MINLLKFVLNPITDDGNGRLSLTRLTFIAIMYSVYCRVNQGQGIDWSVLIIILFLLIYFCFKDQAPTLIGKLFDSISAIKANPVKIIADEIKVKQTETSKEDKSE